MTSQENPNVAYSRKYDAMYDIAKDVWLEDTCGSDCDCDFCSNRPEKPSMAETLD